MEGDAFLDNQENERYQSTIKRLLVSSQKLTTLFLKLAPTIDEFRNLDDQKRQDLRSLDDRVANLLDAIELGKMIVKSPRHLLGQSYSSMMVGHTMIEEYAGDNQESVTVICTDPHNDIIAKTKMFKGGEVECRLYLDRIFHYALLHNACGIILVHNHPSGDVAPSDCDEQFRNRVAKAGRLLGVPLLDFVIVGADCYFSWAEGKAALQIR